MSERIIDELMKKKNEGLALATNTLTFLHQPTTLVGQGLDRQAEVESLEECISKLKRLTKPRTYRQVARKEYLKTAQNKNPSKKTLRRASGKPPKTWREEPDRRQIWPSKDGLRDGSYPG